MVNKEKLSTWNFHLGKAEAKKWLRLQYTHGVPSALLSLTLRSLGRIFRHGPAARLR
jgi:hypothetical protein